MTWTNGKTVEAHDVLRVVVEITQQLGENPTVLADAEQGVERETLLRHGNDAKKMAILAVAQKVTDGETVNTSTEVAAKYREYLDEPGLLESHQCSIAR